MFCVDQLECNGSSRKIIINDHWKDIMCYYQKLNTECRLLLRQYKCIK